MLTGWYFRGAHIIILIFIISDAPTKPLLKSIDEMLKTFYLHQHVFETTVIVLRAFKILRTKKKSYKFLKVHWEVVQKVACDLRSTALLSTFELEKYIVVVCFI